MENKIVKKLVENISEEERLSLEEGMFFNKHIPDLDENIKLKLKMKSREKYAANIKYKRKISIKQIIGNIAVMVGIIFFCGSVIMLIIEKGYSYTSDTEILLPSDGNMNVMEKAITINEDEEYLSLKSVIWSDKDKAIFTTLEGNGSLPSQDGIICINDKEIISSSYRLSNGGESWRLGHIFNIDFNYNEDDKITYTIAQPEGENISFDIKLIKSEGEIDFKDLGPSNVKEGIAIIGIINEEENILDVDFASVVEGKGAEVIKYGDELSSTEFEPGIVLTDANGKVVIGEEVYNGAKSNNFQFDTTDLVKPYKITIPKVSLGIYDMGKNNEVIRLKLPKEGKREIDREIKLFGNNYIGMDNNRTARLVDIKKIEDKCYEINIEFPNNKDNNIKVSSVGFNPVSNIINYKKDFVEYGEELDKNNILKKIVIETTNKNDKYIRFNLKPKYYVVEGNWELEIE